MRISQAGLYDCERPIGQMEGAMWGGMSKPRGKVWNGPQMSPKVGNRIGNQEQAKEKGLRIFS